MHARASETYCANFLAMLQNHLNMKNENISDCKRSGKQPLSELNISQSVTINVEGGVIVTKRKTNVKNISVKCWK